MADVNTKKKNCPVLMAVALVKRTRCKNIESTSKLSDNEESDNPGHNILELYNVLVQIRVAASETKRDI